MRDLFFKDLGWKLFSLVLAGFIWFTVHKIIEPQAEAVSPASVPVTYGEVPVLIVDRNADVHLYHARPETVSVTVSGLPEIMSVLQGKEIRATVDLSDLDLVRESDLMDVPVNVSTPRGVTLSAVEPDAVDVLPPPKK